MDEEKVLTVMQLSIRIQELEERIDRWTERIDEYIDRLSSRIDQNQRTLEDKISNEAYYLKSDIDHVRTEIIRSMR